jgi:hypothetical protein
MKTSTIRTAKVAALALALLSTQQSKAALVYNDGDLILAFRATGGTGGTTNVLLNIGNASVYRDATSQVTLSLGNLDGDLDSVFGATWNTRIDLNWSISGTQFAAGNGFTTNRNLIASRAQAFPLAPLGSSNSTAWAKATLSTQGSPALKMQSLGGKFGTGTTGSVPGTDQIESTNTPGFGLIQPQAQANSFEEFMSGGSQSSSGSSYAYFSGGIEGTFGNGASGAALDLYMMAPGTGAGAYEGTFTITDNATITFTPTGVPEPGSALMLALGCTALLTKRRRQTAA